MHGPGQAAPRLHACATSTLRALLAGRGAQTALLAALVIGMAGFSIGSRRQLGTIAGFTAPDAALGFNLAAYGVIGVGDEPTILKAPGHAVFVAAVTRLWVGRLTVNPGSTPSAPPVWRGLVPPFEPSELERAAHTLYIVHALLLAAATSALFLWLSSMTARSVAFALSLAFGISPFSIVLVGLLHYALPHLFLLVVSTWLLHLALRPAADPHGWRMAAAGLAWGLSTTVRSVTLPMPAFVLLALVVARRPLRKAAGLAAVFALAFAVGVAPAAVRASRLAGRLVPVNAQAWASLWNVTLREVPAMPNHFRWKAFREDFLQLQSATAGQPLEAAGDPYRVSENLTMEDIARAQTFEHVRRDARPYLANVAHSFVSFNWDTSSVLLQLYRYAQRGRPGFPNWFWPGTPQNFRGKTLREAFTWLVRALTLLAAAGLVIAARKRDPVLWPAIAAYACLGAAHSLVWLDLLYYYAKLPFLYVGAAYALDCFGRAAQPWVARVARVLPSAIVLATLAMSAALLGSN